MRVIGTVLFLLVQVGGDVISLFEHVLIVYFHCVFTCYFAQVFLTSSRGIFLKSYTRLKTPVQTHVKMQIKHSNTAPQMMNNATNRPC